MNLQSIIGQVTGRNTLELVTDSGAVQTWLGMYQGYVREFHDYTVYNGKSELKFRRFSLCMPKKASEDWANLLMNEKTDITLGDEASQKVMEDIFDKCHFWKKMNEGVEKSFALGYGAAVVSVDNMTANADGRLTVTGNEKINVSFINRTKIRPITVEDDKITECAFIRIGTKKTTVSVHIKNEQGNYVIYNFECDGTNEEQLNLTPNNMWTFDTMSPLPWFTIIKPNISNNIDVDSPLGVSIFANAVDISKGIDIAFDSLTNEFALGKMRIYVNIRDRAIDVKTGQEQPVFDSNDVVHYILPESDDGQQMITAVTPTLRVADHQQGLQQLLNLFSYACGFGTEHYKFDGAGVATATQVISDNSEMFRNIKKHEILIEDALKEIVNAVIYATNTFTNQRMVAGTPIEVKFDDSIIEDKQAEKAADRLDVAMNVMSKAEFRSKWYNEDLATAQRKIDEIDSVTIDDTDFGADFGADGANDENNTDNSNE